MFSFLKKTQKPAIKLHNSTTKKLEVFSPIDASKVKMYTCGPTVYDHAQIGNLRSFILADLLKRTLLYNGHQVENTINFTDFGHLTSDADTGEDKMMKGLKREGRPVTLESMRDFATTYIDGFKSDLEDLNILPPTHWTRASDYVQQQIALIKTLVDKGYAYETTDGVYFEIAQFKNYGQLGNIDLDALQSGARVEENTEKRHPADFALWKKGVLGWESDWGKGFPGWHIECTAMAFASLGKQIDIHTGGIDLAPTHHNAEIAQAEAITKKPYVRYWLHGEFLQIDGTKIGKSLGNAITLRSLKDKGYRGETYRYWLLTAHYRSPLNFTFTALDAAKQALFRLKRHMIEEYTETGGSIDTTYELRFLEAINDDLNTPQAIAILWELVKDSSVSNANKRTTILEFDKVLALGLSDTPDDVERDLGVVTADALPAEIQSLITDRETARKAKDWETADRLRDEINLAGYSLEDSSDGPKVVKA